jgi:hypothetical protein
MRLLLVFLTSLLVGQSISIGVGLLVERHATPYTGLVLGVLALCRPCHRTEEPARPRAWRT